MIIKNFRVILYHKTVVVGSHFVASFKLLLWLYKTSFCRFFPCMKFVALNPYFVWQNEIIEHQMMILIEHRKLQKIIVIDEHNKIRDKCDWIK
jgi:hypothetical protein